MPIVVEHDNGDTPDIQAALALLLAQSQQAQEAQAQQAQQVEPQPQGNPLDHILAQIAPLTSRMNGSNPAAGMEVNGDPSYQTHAQPSPRYVNHNGGRSGSVNPYDKLANQDALAQYRANQQLERQDDQQSQQAEMEAMQAADAMSRQQAHDVPEWIQQGISNQSLKYSPAQLRERQQLQDSIDRAHSDPSWTPQQRARFEARQREQIRRIDLSPQQVPYNERPVTAEQQAAQTTWVENDPVTGQDVEWQMETRAGATKKVPTARGQAVIDDWRDEQKFKRQQQLKQMELDARAATAAAKPAKDTPAQRAANELKRADMHARLTDSYRRLGLAKQAVADAGKARKAAQATYSDPENGGDASEMVKAVEDENRAQQELRDVEKEQDDFIKQAQAAAEQSASENDAASAAPPHEVGGIDDMMQADQEVMREQQPPDWYLALPPGASYTAPDGSPRVKK